MAIVDKLLDLINAKNPHKHPLTSDQVTFAAPVPNSDATWNTKVTVSSVPGKGYRGNVDVFYHRIELTELGTSIGFISEEPFTPETIVSMLNEKLGITLTLTELDAVTVPAMTVGDIETVVLAAKSDSFGWVGEIGIDLLFGLPDNDELHQLVTNTLPSSGYLTR